jgi:hypothetical protein
LIVDQFKISLADSGIKVTIDGQGRLRVHSRRLDPFDISVQIKSVVTTQKADGLETDGKGHFLLSASNLCFKLIPTAFCEDELKTALSGAGLKQYSVEDGMLIVHLNNSQKLVLRFDPLANSCADSARPQAQPAFSMVGNFSHQIDSGKLRLNFADGSYQDMPPSMMEWNQLTGFLNTYGIDAAANPCSGIVTVSAHSGSFVWKGKPDYFYQRDQSLSPFFTGIKPAGDLNGDGLEDFYFCYKTWKQALYTLPQP